MRGTFVKVKFQFDGMHKWKDAPEEVKFLRNYHRHLFKIEVVLQVTHQDRDIEFFMAIDNIKNGIEGMKIESCEMVAKGIYGTCRRLGYDVKYVEVSEDGENSGIYGDY